MGNSVEMWAVVRWNFVKEILPAPEISPHIRGEGYWKELNDTFHFQGIPTTQKKLKYRLGFFHEMDMNVDGTCP